jgi:vacuolar protein sorting-associated protein VTA1
MGDNEAITSELVGYAHVENFAIKIFGKADDEDRAGQGSQ